jgi:hypothetical protein
MLYINKTVFTALHMQLFCVVNVNSPDDHGMINACWEKRRTRSSNVLFN